MQMTVDTKEIRGLNLRIMVTLVLATISIVSTVLITKNSLENQIRNVANDQVTFSKVNDLNLKIFDVKISSLESRLSAMEKEVNQNHPK